MAKRSKDWNEGLAEDLQDPKFGREFLTAAVEEGIPLQQAPFDLRIGLAQIKRKRSRAA